MDKTGTLTDNVLVVEDMLMPPDIKKEMAVRYISAYIQGTGDTSQTVGAIDKFIGHQPEAKIVDTLNFSSWRQYGAVLIQDADKDHDRTTAIFVGQPEAFLPHLSETEKHWLESLLEAHSHTGKHMLCVVRSENNALSPTLSGTNLSLMAVFVFFNNLREGIRDTVDFFQKRGIRIRIISGDSVGTTCSVAALAGVNDSDKCISGDEMEKWSEADYEEKVKLYSVFGKIVPEQKERIITAFKKNGFTAMIGDGANDALAIKNADLGIAMFDGSPAIRQLAAIVLTNNSFSALPGGVELADSIIKNLEIFASLFINQTILGIIIFVLLSAFGHEYPITPLNITLINYFTVGIPGLLISYWAIKPTGKIQPISRKPFLKKVLPFPIGSAVIQGIGATVVFLLSSRYISIESNMAVIFTFIISGFVFLICTPGVYSGTITRLEKIQFFLLGIFECLFMISIFKIPFLIQFFDITPDMNNLPQTVLWEMIGVMIVMGASQYIFAKWLSRKMKKSEH
jgi:cation-transporting ATPase E